MSRSEASGIDVVIMVAVVAVVAVVTDVVVPDHPEPGSKVHTSLRSLQQSPFKVQNSSQKQATNAVPVCFTLSPQLPAHDAQGVKITSGVAGRKGASCVDPLLLPTASSLQGVQFCG